MSDKLEIPGKISPVALNLPENMDFEDWERAGKVIGMLGNASGWYIGDWLNYGEHQYGEKYAQAAELTGYDPSTLQGFQFTSSKVPVKVRRATLTFSHHREVAPLEVEEQEKWLALAEKNNWSRGEFRAKLKGEDLGFSRTESKEKFYRFVLHWDEEPTEVAKEAIAELCDVYGGKILKIQIQGLKVDDEDSDS